MPACTWQGKSEKNEIFLTFDDGPIPHVTEWVLETLERFQAKATFFCVGDNIQKHPGIFQKILDQGHSIGNHTYHHLKGWKTPNPVYFENIQKWEETVAEHDFVLNNKPLFRPPYGQISPAQANYLKLKYEIVMWSIITGDFDRTLNQENCLIKSLKMTEAGTVIVFHDSLKSEANLKAILPRYLEKILNAGFTFARMG